MGWPVHPGERLRRTEHFSTDKRHHASVRERMRGMTHLDGQVLDDALERSWESWAAGLGRWWLRARVGVLHCAESRRG